MIADKWLVVMRASFLVKTKKRYIYAHSVGKSGLTALHRILKNDPLWKREEAELVCIKPVVASNYGIKFYVDGRRSEGWIPDRVNNGPRS